MLDVYLIFSMVCGACGVWCIQAGRVETLSSSIPVGMDEQFKIQKNLVQVLTTTVLSSE